MESLLVPFAVFILCVVALFVVAGKIASQEEVVLGSEQFSVYPSFKESDSVLKRVVMWGVVITGAVVFLVSYLYMLSFLVKTGFVFRSLISLVSLMLVYTFAGCLTKKVWNRYAIAFVVTLAWFVYPNWITLDIAAVCMTLVFLVNLKDVTFRSAAIISLVVMIYDVVSVFGTGVMQKVASGVLTSVPMLFIIPKHLTLESERAFALGLGDVVIPGVIIMIAMREARNYGYARIGWSAIFGYVLGGILTLSVVVITKAPQPATIYLIPCTFLFLLLAVYGTPVRDKFLSEFGSKPILPLEQPG